jgi:transcriptional regulator with XRE-family HTH domain
MNMTVNYQDLGLRVRDARKAKHLTQEQVGISSSFMGHIERGTRIASIDTLVSICNVLSVSPCLLLGASLSENAVDFPYTNDNRERSFMLDFVSLAQRTVRRWDETESAPEEAPKTEE